MKNPHEILGVTEDASVEEIEEQYSLLSAAHHSQEYISDEQKKIVDDDFGIIRRAYDELLAEASRDSATVESQQSEEEDLTPLESIEKVDLPEEPLPALLSLRMVAFAMDSIFIIFACLVASQAFFPNEMSSGRETMEIYNERIHDLENALADGDSSAEESIRQTLESLVQEPSVLEMTQAIVLCFLWIGVSYWFAGERFFGGSSLGKRVFSLTTLHLPEGKSPSTGIALFRAFLKTIPFIQQFLLFSYLIPFFNRRRMTGHDYICKTMVVRGQPILMKRETSTNASP